MEEARRYVIVEEVEVTPSAESSSKGRHSSCVMETKRVLADAEIVYLAQSAWKGKGLFRLVAREEAPSSHGGGGKESSSSLEKTESSGLKPKALSRLTRTAKGSLKKLNRIGRMASTKSKESSTERESSPGKSDSLESETNSTKAALSAVLKSPARRAVNIAALPERSTCSVDEVKVKKDGSMPNLRRDVHSEGESETLLQQTESDLVVGVEDPEAKMAISSLSRLKRLSIKRWKVWR